MIRCQARVHLDPGSQVRVEAYVVQHRLIQFHLAGFDVEVTGFTAVIGFEMLAMRKSEIGSTRVCFSTSATPNPFA